NRARTYDPLLVRQMLSQLSYASVESALQILEFASQPPLCFAFLSFRFPLPTDDIISQPFSFVNTFFKVFLIFLKVFFGDVLGQKNRAVRMDCPVGS
ncbi:MAG: hypothetical protein IKU40_10185, partial [Clostridia bacterium]|nr:hypothetical protein [Clostridia bacterium]